MGDYVLHEAAEGDGELSVRSRIPLILLCLNQQHAKECRYAYEPYGT